MNSMRGQTVEPKPVNDVAAHVMRRTLTEIVIVSGHEARTRSREFSRSIRRIKKDGHYRCWVTGAKDGDVKPDGTVVNLQVHHHGAEYCHAKRIDFNKLKIFCEEWDPYGYGRLMRNIPMISVDDVRNCLVLSEEYHIGGMTDGVANGIHYMSFSAWVAQKLCKDGDSPVPENTADLNADLVKEGVTK